MESIDEIYRSEYLRADDLPDHDVTWTVTGTRWETMKSGVKNEKKLVVSFLEEGRDWVCGKLCARRIAAFLNAKVPTQWHGAKLTLFKTDVEFGNDIVKGIRVRHAEPKQARQAQQAPTAGGDGDPGPQDGDRYDIQSDDIEVVRL